MKKNIYLLFLSLILFACNEKEEFIPIVDPDTHPLSGEFRYEIYDVAHGSPHTFKANTTLHFEIEEVGTSYLNISKEIKEDYVEFTISCKDASKVPITTLVKLLMTFEDTSIHHYEKVIILRNSALIDEEYLNSSNTRSTGPAYTEKEENYLNKSGIKSKLGQTIRLHLNAPYEASCIPAFDFGILRSKQLIYINDINDTHLNICSGNNYEETHQMRTVSFGLGGFGPLGGKAAGWTLGGQFNYSENKNVDKSKYHLYDIRDYTAIKFESHIHPAFNDICNITDKSQRVEYVDSIMKYASPSFIYTLQNCTIDNIDAAKSFLQSYGTHIVTAGMFGATIMSQFDMHQDMYHESIEHSAGVQLYSKKSSEGGTNEMAKALLSIFGFGNQAKIETSATGSDNKSKLIQNTKNSYSLEAHGGPSVLDPDELLKNTTIENSVMIAFNNTLQRDENGITKGLPNYGLIPLWDLFLDETKRNLLIEAFESFRNKIPDRYPLVLADVTYKYFAGDAVTNHNKVNESQEREQYIYPYVSKFQVAPGRPENELTYYPMVPNMLYNGTVYEGRNDAVFDPLCKMAAGCVYSGIGVFYYALGRADEVDGVEDVIFVKDKQIAQKISEGYNKRGNSSREGLHIAGRYDVYMCAKYGNLNKEIQNRQNPAHLAKGIAIVGANDGEVFTSSLGTTYLYDRDFKDGQNIFQYYYSNGTNHGSQQFADYTGGLLGVWEFYPSITKKVLIDTKGNQIYHFDDEDMPKFEWFAKGDRYK